MQVASQNLDVTNQANANSSFSGNTLKTTPQNDLTIKKQMFDLDESVMSNADDLDYDMKPASSFQFFKNQEIPIFNYDMMENKFLDG